MNKFRRLDCSRVRHAAAAVILGVALGAPPADAAPPKGRASSTAVSAPKVKGVFEPVNIKEDLRLDDVFFITPELGYVSGHSGSIFRTTDGGGTWSAQLGGDPRSEERPIEMLRFFDDRHGWAVQHDKFLRTTDGESWEEIGQTLDGLRDYVFVTETTGFALGGPNGYPKYVYKSTNAGKTWKQVFELTAKVEIDGLTKEAQVWGQSLYFPTETTGYVGGGLPMCGNCGGPPLLAKTEDGGETWTVSLGPGDPKTSAIVRVFFLDEANGFVVLQEGKVFATADAGQTWRGLVGSPEHDLQFADPEVAWSYDDGTTLTYTVDGGRRWSSREVRLPAHARAMSLPRRDRAYIVGEHGMIYRYRIVPLDYKVPNMIEGPLMPGYDTALDEEAEELATEVAALEEAVSSQGGAGESAGGGSATEIEEEEDAGDEGEGSESATEDAEDDAEEADSADSDESEGDDAVVASAGAVAPSTWSAQKYSTRLQKIQAALAAVTGDIPKFQGKLRNLNLVFFGLQILSDLTDHSVAAQTALASFRSARDPQSARAAVADLSQAAGALLATARGAFGGKSSAP